MVSGQRRRRRTWGSPVLAAVVVLGALGVLHVARADAATGGTSYYVDAAGGNDGNAGTSENAAWKTLAKVNGTTFHAGDRILLRAGQSWTGQLWPKGSGAAGSPIVLDAYGSGAKPRINGAGGVNDAVRLFNQEYWEIHNLEVTNAVPATSTPGANLKDLRGIHISGDNSQTLDYFRVEDVVVHDVSGQVNWISGDVADNAPGIHFKTGWDGSKKTGGIVFDTTVPNIKAPPSAPTILNDLAVENSTIRDTSFAGIVVKQYTGDGTDDAGNVIATATGWGTRTSASDAKFKPHTKVVIRNNFITQGGTAYGCNGMYLTDIRGGLVEHNTVDKAGTSGIEMYYADDITVQHNEVYRTQKKAGGADSNGIDPDKGTTRIVVQYNFVHDNGDGILLCEFAFGDVVVRYNILTGNTRYPIYLHSDKAAVAQVYNNTVYNKVSSYLIYGYGSSLAATYTIRNNILYSTKANATLTTSSTITYSNNLYAGATLPIPSGDTRARTGDPKFANPGVSGPYGTADTGPQLDTGLAYRLGAGSAAIDTGLSIGSNGGLDYAGASIYHGAPDIGALEYGATAGPTATPSPISSATPSPTRTTGPTGVPTSPSPTISAGPSGSPGPTAVPTATAGPSASCAVTYQITSQWTSGFQGDVTVRNTGTAALTGWTLQWTFAAGQTVGQGWNATVTQSGATVAATNASWNGTIAANGTASFGFTGTWTGSNPVPAGFSLNGRLCTAGA